MAMGAASPKLRKLAAGNAFVGQQYRNAIVNAIDALRIDSDGVMHVTAAFHARLTMLASDMKVVSQP